MDSKGPGVGKDVFDRTAAALGILLTSPVLLICAAAVWIDDGAPVFFRQVRVGKNGRLFRLVKFRSMRSGQRGTSITVSNDSRITRAGGFLRSYKLDELPQLWNVLRGDMSFVGPRPEVPEYVELASPEWRIVLSVKPGITDLATLLYRNEEKILFLQPDPQRYYREVVLPAKMSLSIAFIRASNFWLECKLIAYTIYYSVFPHRLDSGRLGRIFAPALADHSVDN